jgi:hypothetical protein
VLRGTSGGAFPLPPPTTPAPTTPPAAAAALDAPALVPPPPSVSWPRSPLAPARALADPLFPAPDEPGAPACAVPPLTPELSPPPAEPFASDAPQLGNVASNSQPPQKASFTLGSVQRDWLVVKVRAGTFDETRAQGDMRRPRRPGTWWLDGAGRPLRRVSASAAKSSCKIDTPASAVIPAGS